MSNNTNNSESEGFRYTLVLTRRLVVTDFKLRYQGSMLGYLWSLLRPLFIFLILYVVFVRFIPLGKDVPHYPVYLLTGIILWTFFVEVTTSSVKSIVDRGDLLRKINFPRYVIVISSSLSSSINLMINMCVVLLFALINGVHFGLGIILVPLLLLELVVVAMSFAFLLSAAYVRFRDISHIWEVVIQAAFYATPIIYPLTKVPESVGKLMLYNPLAQIIQDVRYVLITKESATFNGIYSSQLNRLIPIVLVVLLFIISGRLFKNRAPYFAEEV